ncbi:MAG: glucosaminidase domain-containing protein [Marinagarivorans sp.]|nr:glucosaminidase domain-containing protein [Marinagarivorans sp.]
MLRKIQKALNIIMQLNILAPLKPLSEDGFSGRNTKCAIRRFQQVALGVSLPDGRIDPNGKSLKKLNAIITNAKKIPPFSIFKLGKWSASTIDELLCETFRQFNSVQFGLLAGQPIHRAQMLSGLGSLTKNEFVNKVFSAAKKEALVSLVPAAVTTAQAILETGYGKSVPTDIYTKQYSYNLFGIKGIGSAGSVSVYTHEVVGGKRIKIVDKFQAYHSFDESISGRTKFLKSNRRYKSLFETSDPKEWAEGLQKAGYATDPNYAKLLISIMNSWKLI